MAKKAVKKTSTKPKKAVPKKMISKGKKNVCEFC